MWGGLDIVGVVGDTRQGGLDTEPLPEVSLAYNDARIESMLARDVTLIVRSSLSAAAATAAVGAALREVDSQQPLHTVRTLDEVIEESLGGRRLTLGLIGSFAAVAALLAGIGLYALVSQLVVQRRREIGVRMALGATARAIGRWVVAEGLSLTGLGVVLGLAGGWGASKLVAHQLYDVGPLDPWTWSAVLAFVAAVALAATLGPALRAARTEPSQVLHEE
jgi:ABC-type antimicrobial peptide transport system permease subunit